MAEVITLETFHSPFEVDRSTDEVNGDVMVTLEKPHQEVIARAYVGFNSSGKHIDSTIQLAGSNDLSETEVTYHLQNRSLRISASSLVTHFTEVAYNRNGDPISIHPHPLYSVEHMFWRELASSEDNKAAVEVRDQGPYLYAMTKTNDRILALTDYEQENSLRILRRRKKWMFQTGKRMENGLEYRFRTLGEIIPHQLFYYDEQLLLISETGLLGGSSLMFVQGTMTADRIKITAVPSKVDGQVIYDLIAGGESWEQVFDLYPSKFYIDA